MENEMKSTGWNAITELCDKVYPNQTDPKHYGTLISWGLGGNDLLKGIITIPDDKFNGKVKFVEFVGVTDSELKAIINKNISIKGLYKKIGSDITNYNRKPVVT